MSGRPGRSAQPPPGSNRQNEYFVPRDGIDREVITADICRYLGNDALVRPGVYENPATGQVVQGYFITAYRNLTTAMIEDLKADSARWDQERRQQTARNPVGVQYRNSDTHQSRQYYGPTEASGGPSYADNARDSFDATPRYPGTGSGGYNGASNTYPQTGYANQGGYGGQAAYGSAPAPQFSQPSADQYPGSTTMTGAAYSASANDPRPYTQTVNRPVRGAADPQIYGSTGSDPYQQTSSSRIPVSTLPPGMTSQYVTAGSVPQAGYTSSPGGAYYGSSSTAATSGFAVQPQDPFYGRGNTYSSTHDQQQYETIPTPRTSAASSNTQMATSGSSSRRDRERERDRDRDRDSVDRTHTDSRQRHHRR